VIPIPETSAFNSGACHWLVSVVSLKMRFQSLDTFVFTMPLANDRHARVKAHFKAYRDSARPFERARLSSFFFAAARNDLALANDPDSSFPQQKSVATADRILIRRRL
jgi:hypothetical protein